MSWSKKVIFEKDLSILRGKIRVSLLFKVSKKTVFMKDCWNPIYLFFIWEIRKNQPVCFETSQWVVINESKKVVLKILSKQLADFVMVGNFKDVLIILLFWWFQRLCFGFELCLELLIIITINSYNHTVEAFENCCVTYKK